MNQLPEQHQPLHVVHREEHTLYQGVRYVQGTHILLMVLSVLEGRTPPSVGRGRGLSKETNPTKITRVSNVVQVRIVIQLW